MGDHTGNLDPAVLETVVSDVLISAYGKESNMGVDGEPPTNAWAMFLKTGKGKSVKIGIFPKVDLIGQLSFENKTYIGTYNQVKTVTFPTIDSPTVQRFVDLIYGNGRHKFLSTVQKEGCRHWVLSVITDFGIKYESSCSGCYFQILASPDWFWFDCSNYKTVHILLMFEMIDYGYYFCSM
ncbi:hypothetical protein EMCG_04850 [[Emmonsia] crescens]|uniref:DUF7770 domain-containing protein n=1 Tax=[Emmonsia] crescens TaxID=73230 RepID=A0A0G2J707_9EURO|nr:hypothetical protein EMCG_04850 [Emmonsia crescens UAMH 3008]